MLSAGLIIETIEPEVWNILHPPFSTASRFDVRWIIVPQSTLVYCTLRPSDFISASATRADCWMAG